MKTVARALKEDVDEEVLRDMILEANGGAGVGKGVERDEFEGVMRRAGSGDREKAGIQAGIQAGIWLRNGVWMVIAWEFGEFGEGINRRTQSRIWRRSGYDHYV